MADAAMALSWKRDDVPVMHTLSRHGVLPQTQTEFDPGVAAGGEMMLACAATTRQLLRLTRSYAADLEGAGGDWREVVTLVRQLVPRIWRHLPLIEKRRFLRHLQVHWSTHRHRMPPQVAVHLGMLKARGRLLVNAGRVQRVAALGPRIRVWWQARGRSEEQSLDVDALINATGPEATLSRSSEALMQSLKRQDLISPDVLNLGIRVSSNGECLNAAGEAIPRLYYLGSMLRAEQFEATAVTELRNLAEALADRLRPAPA
jgi:uncharacterized NAD(P)/FAD-binding protein YdhS